MQSVLHKFCISRKELVLMDVRNSRQLRVLVGSITVKHDASSSH